MAENLNASKDYIIKFNKWLTEQNFDAETKKELESIKEDDKEIEDRFYKDLLFGTGGIRGIIGAGTNRMNRYTVGRATQGLANYIIKKDIKNPSVVIAYDSRRYSPEFANESARVLAANGIKAYVFDELRPTPELSFAVRQLGATAGIVITASHNPPEYNGYKAYWNDGAQVVSPVADELINEINSIEDFSCIKCLDSCELSNSELIQSIGSEIDEEYIRRVKTLSLNRQVVDKVAENFKIVYTPLHGTGNKLVRKALKETGFKNVYVVKEQELPDSNFSTVKSPNPEEHDAFKLAIELAEKVEADIIIGTDPDCDRVGAVVKDSEGKYIVLTGNQTGSLLMHYILKNLKAQGRLNERSRVINTIVTGKLGQKIAEGMGVEVISTLTGFKYIAEKIREFEAGGEEFIFGYEESYGYLAGNFVRDKDAVIASMLICEMAAWYKSQGKSLYEALIDIFEEYGYYNESGTNIAFPGKDGMENMQKLIDNLRKNPIKEVEGYKVSEIRDYLDYEGKVKLPKENVLFYLLEDKSWFCVRPSGTEPKLKLYYSVIGNSAEDSEDKMKKMKKSVEEIIKSIPV